jgi:hypothetical protein
LERCRPRRSNLPAGEGGVCEADEAVTSGWWPEVLGLRILLSYGILDELPPTAEV